MRMLMIGTGGVGESILKILKERDPKSKWLKYVVCADYHMDRAEEVAASLGDSKRFVPAQVNAKDKEAIIELIKKHNCDFVMDAAAPFVADNIFDAAYEAGVQYANMGTWSLPKTDPKEMYGVGKQCFQQFMTDYNFDRSDMWAEKGLLAAICLGIDPGVVNVFAKFAAEYLFDELHEIHVKDGGNLSIPSAKEDEIVFGFNVWTVLDEVLNPNVEWDKEKGFIVEPPFAGEEIFDMPEGVGPNKLVKVEHEEVACMPRYLEKYGLKKCTFKIALDENLVRALKVIQALGLRSLNPVNLDGIEVYPRDVVAAVAPQPTDIGNEMIGRMCVGVHCIGIKDGKKREIFMYQPLDNQESMRRWGMQAVVAQTGFGAAIAIELIGREIWTEKGVHSLEAFDPIPYLEIMNEAGFEYNIVEMDSEYKRVIDKIELSKIFAEAAAAGDR
ncbi:saccharopine dehydrogenase family protein [Natronincola ferrireducens]|nr:saccharopine dehydrogenase C-terminal domain-containing protein [Natronincola ferrireducens]